MNENTFSLSYHALYCHIIYKNNFNAFEKIYIYIILIFAYNNIIIKDK